MWHLNLLIMNESLQCDNILYTDSLLTHQAYWLTVHTAHFNTKSSAHFPYTLHLCVLYDSRNRVTISPSIIK
jgi:hypothetical protein